MKFKQTLLLSIVLAALFIAGTVSGATIVVGASQNWSALATLPTSSDTVIVSNSATLTVDVANAQCAAIQLGSATGSGTGTLSFNSGSQLTVSGAVTIGGGATRTGSINMSAGGTLIANSLAVTTAGTWTPGAGVVQLAANNTLPASFFTTFNSLTINSGSATLGVAMTITNLAVSSGAGFVVPGFNITVVGTTTVSGGLTNSSATGTKTFTGDVVINSGGFWVETAAAALSFGGSLQNDGTFTASSGIHTFTGAAKTLGGVNAISIANVTVTGTNQNNGTLTVGTVLTVNSPGILTNNGTLTASTALSGTGTFIQSANAILNIGGTAGITILAATANPNTVNYTGAGQTVKATTYHDLNLSGSGAKTLTGLSTVNGSFSLGGTATAALAANLSIGGDLTVSGGTLDLVTFTANRTSTGGTLTLASGTTLKIGGTGSLPSNYSTHSVAATSTVEYNGTAQTVAALNTPESYGHLIISTAGTKTLAGDTAVAGDFTISAGTNDLNGFSVGRTTGGGNLTVANGAKLKISGTTTMPSNFATHTFGATSTIEYSGAAQNVTTEAYGHLITSGSSVKTISGAAPMTVAGSLTIGTGTTLDAQAVNFSVAGSWTNNGTYAASISQIVTFNGSGTADQNITGSGTVFFETLVVNRTGIGAVTPLVDFQIFVAFTNQVGEFDASSRTITLSGGGTPLTVSGGTFTAGTSTIKYTSATGANVAGVTYNNLTLDSPGQTFTAAGNMTVSSTLTVAAATSFDGSNKTITLPSSGTPFVVNGAFIPSTSTVSYTSTTTAAANITSTTYYNLSVAGNGGGDTFTAIGDIGIGGVLTIGTATFNASSFTLTLSGSGTPLVATGTFTPATSIVRYTSASGANVTGTTYNNLTLDSSGQTFTAAGNMTVGAVLTVAAGTTFDGSSRTITLSGSGTPLVVSGTFTPSTSTVIHTSGTGATVTGTAYNNLTINGAGTFTPAGNLIMSGNLTNLAGTLDLGAFTADRTASGGTMALANVATAILKIGGTGTMPANYSTYTIGPLSTVDYSGTAQAIAGLNNGTNYGNLTLSGNGTKSASANLGVVTTFTVGAGVVFAPDAAVVLNNTTTQGTLTGSGTIQVTRIATTADLASQYKFTTRTLTGLTVDYAGAGDQTVNSTLGNYGALKTSGGGTKTLAGAIVVIGGLTIGSGTPLDVSASNFGITVGGDWINNGGGFAAGTGTVTFNGAVAQAISGTVASQTFNHVTLTKTAGTLLSVGGSTTALTVNSLTETTGNFTAPATLDINGTFTLTAGTFTAGANITIAGDWTKATAATFTQGSGTVTFDGAGTQAINGTSTSQTFNHVVVAKTAGTLLSVGGSTATLTVNNLTEIGGNFTAPITLTIGGTLTLTAGTFTAGTTVNIAGDWTNNGGTFVPGGSTVNFNSTTVAQAINGSATSQTFSNLTVTKAAQTLSIGGSTVTLTVINLTETSGNFTAPSTLDINGNATLTAGTFAGGAATTVAGNWVNNGATFTHNSGTVTFDGTAAQSISGTVATTFNDLTIANASATVTASGNFSVAGTMTVNASTTFSPASTVVINSAAAQGTLTGSGTIQVTRTTATADLVNQYKFSTYTLSSMTVDYAGTLAQSINNTVGSYGALKTSIGGTKTLAGAVTVNGDLTIGTSTVLAAGINNISLGGNWINNVGAAGFTSSGAQTVSFNGGSAQSIGGSAATTFNNLEINNGGGVSMNSGLNPTVSGALTLTSGVLSIGANTLTLNGAISTTGGSLTGGASANITLGGTTVTTLPAVTLNNLIVNRSGGIAIAATVTVNGTLTLSSGAVTGGSNLGLGNGATISRSAGSLAAAPTFGTTVNEIYTGGTPTTGPEIPADNSVLNNLTVSGGTTTLGSAVQVNGSVNLAGGVLNTSANNYAMTVIGDFAVGNGTLTANGSTITVGGNFSGTGTFNANTSTFVFDGTGAQSIVGSSGFGGFNNLTINKTGGTASLAGGQLVSGTLTISAGTFAANGNTLAVTGLTTVSGTGVYQTSTGTQTLTGGLTVSGGTFTASSGTVSAGNISLSSGTLTAPTSAGTFNVSGNWSVSGGTFTHSGGTVTINGTTTQTFSGTTTFNNLTISSGATGNKSFGTSSITIASAFTSSGGTMVGGTSTITFTGAPGSIAGASAKNFYDLVIDSGASVSNSAGSITIQGDFTNDGAFGQLSSLSTTFDNTGEHNLAGGGATIFAGVSMQGSPTIVDAGSHSFGVLGNWSLTSSGTFNPGTSTVTFRGSAAQTIAGATTFNSVTITNGSGVSLTTVATVVTVGGTMSMTAGNLTGSGSVSIASSGTLKGTSPILVPVTLDGAVAPGSSVGRLPSGRETWNSSASYQWEINNAAGAAGTGWDLLGVTNGVNLQATTGSPFNLNLFSLNGASPGLAANFNNNATSTWTMAVTTNGTMTNFAANKFIINDAQFSNDLAGGVFSVSTNNGPTNLSLTFTANHGPLANAATYTRNKGTTLKIQINHLMTNSTSDADGDTRGLVLAGSSTNGSSITTNGTFIFISPTNDLSETISYAVRDLRSYRAGDTVRMATNIITIQVATAGGLSRTPVVADGKATVSFAGIPGYQYQIQRATDLGGPWTTLLTTNAPVNGLFEYVDDPAPEPSAFYRLLHP